MFNQHKNIDLSSQSNKKSYHLEIHASYHAHSVTITGINIFSLASKSNCRPKCFHNAFSCKLHWCDNMSSYILYLIRTASCWVNAYKDTGWVKNLVFSLFHHPVNAKSCERTGQVFFFFSQIQPIWSIHICIQQWRPRELPIGMI